MLVHTEARPVAYGLGMVEEYSVDFCILSSSELFQFFY